MQELRLKSCVMEGVESTGQKDRRDDSECLFETHSKKPVNKQHLEKTRRQNIHCCIEILDAKDLRVLRDPVLYEDPGKPGSKENIQYQAQLHLPLRKADIRKDLFPLLIQKERHENDPQTEDHQDIPDQKRGDRISYRISRKR